MKLPYELISIILFQTDKYMFAQKFYKILPKSYIRFLHRNVSIDQEAMNGNLKIIKIMHSTGSFLTSDTLFCAMLYRQHDTMDYIRSVGITWPSPYNQIKFRKEIDSSIFDNIKIVQ
jgi:hypothetical protein